MSKNGKIAVAMSGGVDSSVAVYLLKEVGFEPIGINMTLWSCFKSTSAKTCCSPSDAMDARKVCEYLKIPFISIDLRDIFKEKLVLSSVREYGAGKTPNPCIKCNTIIKFGSLFDYVRDKLGINLMATGHYARIFQEQNRFHLLRGKDLSKDQSYFLFEIKREILNKIRFPIGDHTKADIRAIAKDCGIKIANKVESEDLCFVPDGDLPAFLEDYFPEYIMQGADFLDISGKFLGKSRGIHAYTIGQRRGLGIGFSTRKYVVRIDAQKNAVILGDEKDLYLTSLKLSNVNMLEDRGSEFEADIKVRYRTKAAHGRVFVGDDYSKIVFDHPIKAAAPGQAAVFYENDIVIGGGWILEVGNKL